MDTSSTRYIDKLASLRFFAAFLVVLFHLGSHIVHQPGIIATISTPITDYGYVGVSIFFVLSGFVISLANERWKGWGNYLVGRATRIYPPHLVVTFALLTPGVIALIDKHSYGGWLKLISNLALVQAWIPISSYCLSLNLVTWSLSVELSFYLAFLGLRHLSDRRLFILTAIGYLVLLIVTLHLHHGRWTFDIYWEFYINPIARLPEFLVGMSLYRIYRAGQIPRLWFPNFNFPLIIGLMLVAMWSVGVYGKMGGTFAEPLDYSIVPLPFIVLLIMALLDARSNPWMNNRYLLLLGESSFALYLLHKPLLDYLEGIMVMADAGSASLRILALSIAIALPISASVLFYKLIEIPLTRSLRHLFVGNST